MSKDLEEVATCLADLNIPYYTHEVVAVALELGFEKETVSPKPISPQVLCAAHLIFRFESIAGGFQDGSTALKR